MIKLIHLLFPFQYWPSLWSFSGPNLAPTLHQSSFPNVIENETPSETKWRRSLHNLIMILQTHSKDFIETISKPLGQSWLPKNISDSKRRKTPTPCSDLYDYIIDLNWHRAITHCQQNTADAEYIDGDTYETPLHVACQFRPPVKLIQVLLDTYPNAALATTRHGDSPLHMACRSNASIEVLRTLVKRSPESASVESKWGKTPLGALWDGREKIGSNRQQENYQTIFWQKVRVLLEAVATARGSPGFIVHAALSLQASGCPIEILEYALDQCPEHINTRDNSGSLPIHLAVAPALFNKSSRRKYKPRQKVVLNVLLEKEPRCAKSLSSESRWPLAVAIENEHSWSEGVDQLWAAAPEALTRRDPVTLLYPYQIAAMKADLDCIYGLLRANPTVVTNTQKVRKPPKRSPAGSNLFALLGQGS